MSGIYIKGMEMPKNCFLCPLSYMRNERLICIVTKEVVLRAKIATECPIVHVPPHGRLIDADALSAKLNMMLAMAFGEGNTAYHFAYRSLGKVVENAPTIIPADKEGEG